MKRILACVGGPLVLLSIASACSTNNPLQPTSPSGVTTAGVITNSSTVAPLVSPAEGEVVGFSQPVTLTITNGVSTAGTTPTYTFEVATDAAFAHIVFSKGGVTQGTGSRTSVTLDVKLKALTTYFWRARLVSDGDPGPSAKPKSFMVGAEVILQNPVPSSPTGNATASDRPSLTVNNVQRSGPAGPVFYRFEVSETAAFTTVIYSATVAERTDSSVTSHNVTLQLSEKSYFWRVQAVDPQDGVTTQFSAANQFKVTKGIDLRTATIVIGPGDIADWKETAVITDAFMDLDNEALCIYHTRLGDWPPAIFNPADGTTTEGNQWVFAFINGQWIGGAADYYRPGQACKGLNAQSIGRDAFYMTPGSPVYSWQPVSGETFAVMVSTPARAWPGLRGVYDERSNVVLMKWP